MVFNEEMVVRRVAACRVPIVSAVGHEVDITLTDLVADARAATPSQAAEMVVADAEARRQALRQLRARLRRAMRARVAEDRAALSDVRADLRAISTDARQQSQQIGRRRGSVAKGIHPDARRRRADIERLHRRLATRHPRAVIAGSRAQWGPLVVRLESAMRAHMGAAGARFSAQMGRLDAMSPLGVLSRGYAIARTESGRAIRSPDEVSPGERISIRVHRGELHARITEPRRPATCRRSNARVPRTGRSAGRGADVSAPLRFAVFGHPVAHSVSPMMHLAAFKALGLPHRYDAVDVPDLRPARNHGGCPAPGGVRRRQRDRAVQARGHEVGR